MADKRYLIYRVYTRKERENPAERMILYGWTSNKSVLKAFLAQRNEKKYTFIRVEEDEIGNFYDENVDDTDIQIDFIKLKCAATKEEFTFLTTMNEMATAEKAIQKYFRELASFGNIRGDGEYVQMVIHLDEYFSSALFYLGYRPQDIDYMCDSCSEEDNFSGLESAEHDIDLAYEGLTQCPQEYYRPMEKPLGLNTLSDVSSKILYSLENVIKVLKDEL